MEQTEVPYNLNLPYSKLTPTLNLASSLSSTTSSIALLLTTSLPLLIAYPIVLISQGLILTTTATTATTTIAASKSIEDGIVNAPLLSLQVAAALASSLAILLLIFIAQWMKIVPHDNETISKETESRTNTVTIYLSIIFALLSTIFLPFDRCSMIIFGLYLNSFNIYTPIMLFLDLLVLHTSSPNNSDQEESKILIVLGYALIGVACTMLRKANSIKIGLNRKVVILTTVAGGIIWLWLSKVVSFSMMTVNLITVVISLVTFQEFPTYTGTNNNEDALQVQV